MFRLRNLVKAVLVVAGTTALSSAAFAGPIFITGHDPDFHAQPGAGVGGTLLGVGLSFATGGTYNDLNPATKKFLWVESSIAPPGGHLRGENGLIALGLSAATQYDVVNAAGLASVNFNNYSAIAIASSFGGLLTRAELDGLIARSSDIANFINAGGGLFASAECAPTTSGACGANLLAGPTAPQLFGYLPVAVTSIGASGPFTVTPFGTSLGLTNSNINDPTHNSFGLVGGLNIVDRDSAGNATTLAGVVAVGGGGFTPVPEPSSMVLLALGMAGIGFTAKRRRT